jgi:ribosomal-protein-alanine N-acetyltransferase
MKPRHPDSRVNIRPASLTDIPSIITLERQSATAGHWTEEQYRKAFQAESGKRLMIVAEASDLAAADAQAVVPEDLASSHNGLKNILGFLIAQQISSDWELENIVVGSQVRRRGIGGQLLNALFAAARETACKTKISCVFLEVRESNLPARRLYESAGFELAGRRKSYYSNPLEDAILYRRPVS